MSELSEVFSQEKEITIQNPIGEKIVLNKVSVDGNSKKKYREVFISEASLLTGNITQGALQSANQSATLAQIAKASPNGLFSATVDPAKLSRFKNGTFTTMIRKGGKLEKHAGFTEVTLKQSVNPAMVISTGMQAMSIISGTYYLNQINSQMIKIDSKLEELLKIHHDASYGKLIAASKGLSEIAVREIVDNIDINAIRNFKKTTDEIYEEYAYSLHRKENELIHSKKIKESDLEDIDFYMSVAFEASKVSLFAELIEIGTRMKIGGQMEMIEGLIKQLELNYSKSFYFNMENEAVDFYSILQKKYEKDLNSKKKANKKIDDLADDIPTRDMGLAGLAVKLGIKAVATVKDNKDSSSAKERERIRQKKLDAIKIKTVKNRENETLDNLITEMTQSLYQELEIIYIPEDDRQRVFIEDIEKSVSARTESF